MKYLYSLTFRKLENHGLNCVEKKILKQKFVLVANSPHQKVIKTLYFYPAVFKKTQ